jgi:hypothetical protein
MPATLTPKTKPVWLLAAEEVLEEVVLETRLLVAPSETLLLA